MLFNLVGTVHSHLTAEQRHAGLRRRAEWKYPKGVTLVHECWRSAAPEFVSTFECDSYEAIMSVQFDWDDFMQVSISPATLPEQGLQIGGKLMAIRKK